MAAAKSGRASTRPTRGKKEVEEQFGIVKASVATQERVDPKTANAQRERETAQRQAVGDISAEKVTQKLASMGLELTRLLSSVQERIVDQIGEMNTVAQVVLLEKEELERLHNIDVAKTAIDLLIAEHDEKRVALDAEIAEQRAKWAKDQQTRDLQWKEAAGAAEQARLRERDDYEYKKANERKKAEDDFVEKQRVADRAVADKIEVLEKNWSTREKAIKDQEVDIATVRAQVTAFPEQLKSEVAREVKIVTNVLTRDHAHATTLLQKEAEADKRVSTSEMAALKKENEQLAASNANLQAQLREMQKQIEAIAGKALDSASGRQSLERVQETIATTARNDNKR